MAHTVPILPCADVDAIAAFYAHLGFERTYRQLRPNPYVVVERGGVALHFAGIPGFDPATSTGSCLLVVEDPAAWHQAFAAGLRTGLGRVPVAGIPRVTRPRHAGGAFSVIDPGGNWIRVVRSPTATGEPADAPAPPTGALARALNAAVKLGESKGDTESAARLLDAALASRADAPARDRVAALVYRAELAVQLRDSGSAATALGEVRAIELDPGERGALAAELARADELAWELS